MQQIISASRRTDIPAFYADWFLNRLTEGFCDVRQPYTGRLHRVSLAPEDAGAIVFWSKNYRPLLPLLEKIERRISSLYFHFTITGNRDLEIRTPDFREAAADYLYLAKRYASDRVIWRFDPITITDRLSYEVHEERFAKIAELLHGHTAACIISFAHPYRKVIKNMQKYTSQALLTVSETDQRVYAGRLSRRAEAFGIRLFSCCNDHLLSDHVGKARCIDGRSLSLLFRTPLDTTPAGIRKTCGCTKSIDIGAYDTCGHGCVYCYANTDQKKAAEAPSRIDPDASCLAPDPPGNRGADR